MINIRHLLYVLTLGCAICSSETTNAADPEMLNKTVDIQTTITAVTAAELDISETRVSMTDSWRIKLFSPTDLDQRKSNLIVKLCREVGADVLVDPQFTFTKRPLGGGKLTVSGYPAKYTNFRSMSDKEVDAFITTPEYKEGKVVFINK